jgi:lysozyme family protein
MKIQETATTAKALAVPAAGTTATAITAMIETLPPILSILTAIMTLITGGVMLYYTVRIKGLDVRERIARLEEREAKKPPE